MLDGLSWATSFGACLVGAGLASSMEAALVGVTEGRVREAEQQKKKRAALLAFWLRHPGRVLTTLHLVRLCFVLGAGVSAVFFADERGIVAPPWAIAVVAALLVLLFSHLLPRTVAKAYALSWSLQTIRVVKILTYVLAPVVWPMLQGARLLAGLFGVRRGVANPFWTSEEIGRLAVDAETQALGKRGKELLRSIIEFSDTVIREIMVPRTEMVAIEVNSPATEVRRAIVEAGHSRIPIYEETIDNIIGVLHVKDLFTGILAKAGAELPVDFDLRAAVRPTFYVPEVMKISELLREFQRRKTHLAIVIDEYGGTAGVVTLEDIIEEIVGEIQDEYDVEEKQFRVLADNKIIADGRVNIWELEQTLKVDFPDDADYETLAGFIVSRAGYLPPAGAVINWGVLRFTIKEADERRIATVEIERRKPSEAGPPSPRPSPASGRG